MKIVLNRTRKRANPKPNSGEQSNVKSLQPWCMASLLVLKEKIHEKSNHQNNSGQQDFFIYLKKAILGEGESNLGPRM